MNHHLIIRELIKNRSVFQHLLQDTVPEQQHWKPEPSKWSLLEVTCHLLDEEKEDFRARMKHAFKTPELPLPPIDPVGWVTERKYHKQPFDTVLGKFLEERLLSVEWLSHLQSPNWQEVHLHPKFGAMTPEFFLANWLAHDYLHLRQITALKHAYLKAHAGTDLGYAGAW